MTDAATLQQTGYKMEKTDKLLNMAVVPDKSRARVRFNGGNPELQRAWYQSQVAKFFLFDQAPLSVSGAKGPVLADYHCFTINPGQPGGEMEFCTDPNSTQTHNVVATVPGDKAYSPLWLRVVYDSRLRLGAQSRNRASGKEGCCGGAVHQLPDCLDQALE